VHRTESRYAVERKYTKDIPYPAISADALTTIQEEICNAVEGSGQVLDSNNNTQLSRAINIGAEIYTYVTTQAEFDALFERTAPNTYQFLPEIKAVVFHNLSAFTFSIDAADTHAEISTNQVKKILSFGTAFINVGDTASKIIINTNNCEIDGVVLQGEKLVSAPHTSNFLIDADGVKLTNCKAQYFLSTNEGVDYKVFDLNGKDAILKNCYVQEIEFESNNEDVFSAYANGLSALTEIHNCSVEYLTIDGDAVVELFENLYNVLFPLAGNGLYFPTENNITVFKNCYNVQGADAKIDTAIGSIGKLDGGKWVCFFHGCEFISDATTELITSNDVNSSFAHYKDCKYIENVELIGGRAAGFVYGFDNCEYITNIHIDGFIPSTNEVNVIDALDRDVFFEEYRGGVWTTVNWVNPEPDKVMFDDSDTTTNKWWWYYCEKNCVVEYNLSHGAGNARVRIDYAPGKDTTTVWVAPWVNIANTATTNPANGTFNAVAGNTYRLGIQPVGGPQYNWTAKMEIIEAIGNIDGVNNSNHITNGLIENFDGDRETNGIKNSNHITNINIQTLETIVEEVNGFNACNHITACKVNNITAENSGGNANCNGIKDSDFISATEITDLTGGGAGTTVYGINNSNRISSTLVNNIALHASAGDRRGVIDSEHICSTRIIDSNTSTGCNYVDDEDSAVTKKFSCQGF
jgi:hypothetical protein